MQTMWQEGPKAYEVGLPKVQAVHMMQAEWVFGLHQEA
jgi:hypothetical protein